ncbi:hypothetical protein [Methanobrevibacter sp.]|uniref:hypothetical protein n=1 Tax=Methanobrevibacter sp. TaxID=66852 RepID=UPI00388E90B7
MIKIEEIMTYGWEEAIRGMRNPMNSWDKSDSHYGCYMGHDEPPHDCSYCPDICGAYNSNYLIGPKDHELMMKLGNAGNDHAKFLRMITVYMDITAPLYWWKEFDTYKVGTVANSCSTMHKIHAKEFELDDFSCEHLIDFSWNRLYDTIKHLNYYREKYIETKNKEDWWQMIQLLPSSYNQKRTVQLNYAVLKNMYHSRKNHKLDEWHDFCKMIEELPYSELITGERA